VKTFIISHSNAHSPILLQRFKIVCVLFFYETKFQFIKPQHSLTCIHFQSLICGAFPTEERGIWMETDKCAWCSRLKACLKYSIACAKTTYIQVSKPQQDISHSVVSTISTCFRPFYSCAPLASC
jgi:hypothetical protein